MIRRTLLPKIRLLNPAQRSFCPRSLEEAPSFSSFAAEIRTFRLSPPRQHCNSSRNAAGFGLCGRRVNGDAYRSFTNSPMHGRPEGSVDAATTVAPKELWRGPSLARFYLLMLDKHPVLTKSITAGTIYCLADITSQGITILKSDAPYFSQWDVARTLRMVAAGLFLSGPTLHLWFNFLSNVLPKRDVVSTVKKMVLGQTLYGPALTVIFFSLNALVQGETTTEIAARLRRDFFPTIRSGLMYWPLCDFITYRYVPVHLQPLVSNSFSYIWTVYLTYMAGLKKATAITVS